MASTMVMVKTLVWIEAIVGQDDGERHMVWLREDKRRKEILRNFGRGPHAIIRQVRHPNAGELILIRDTEGKERWVSMRFFMEA